MKVAEFVSKDNEYYETVRKIFGEWEVLDSKTIKTSETQTIIFMKLSIFGAHYAFCTINRFGVGFSKPTDYDEATYNFEYAIKDTENALGIKGGEHESRQVH